jgi:hypothetical protein
MLREKLNHKSHHIEDLMKDRHDMGIHHPLKFKEDDLVMLYDSKVAKQKLHPSYRGPFIIVGLAGDHGTSYKLRQVDGTAIKRTFYGDHLKPFKQRTGHMLTGKEAQLASYQILRAGKAKHKVPSLTCNEVIISGVGEVEECECKEKREFYLEYEVGEGHLI